MDGSNTRVLQTMTSNEGDSPTSLGQDPEWQQSLGIRVSPYDNDITLLYKWSEKTEVPISLIVVQPRNSENASIPGSKNYVFESLPQLVSRLLQKSLSASEAYSIIINFNSSITVRDFTMVYYDLLKKSNPGVDLCPRINEVILEIKDSFVAYGIANQRVGDDFTLYEAPSMLQVAYDSWHTKVIYSSCPSIARRSTESGTYRTSLRQWLWETVPRFLLLR